MCGRSVKIFEHSKGSLQNILGCRSNLPLRISSSHSLQYDYGCIVYGSARPTVLRRLDTIHHSADLLWSIPYLSSGNLYVICHQLPLHLRRQKISALYFQSTIVPRHQ
ncbi:hypothetical protein AVEN_124652-1 [Araneus ventricosus]|uniref:Uncharacterized protein n=1 Tax=Araneus ventricosus TaxID=182803 RepID=A0A4Y2VLN8_ARAVE|nr:hypothetical protein AVEN_124652-1 [Araneus ventricosus]